jgi:type 1 fimbria pilin
MQIMNMKHILQATWRQYIRWGLIFICVTFNMNAYAACKFVNNAHKASLKVNLPNLIRTPAISTYVSASFTLSYSAIASAMGIPNGYTTAVNCTAGESLIIGNSGFTPMGNYVRTNVSGVLLNAQAQTTSVWAYPKNGANYTRAIPASGNISPFFLTTGTETGAYIIIHQIVSGKLLKGGAVNGGLLLNISTSDGLDIMDITVSGFTVTVPTCTVNSYDSQVKLGSAFTQRMKGVDSVMNATPFTISMTCAATTGLSSGLTPTLTFSGDATGTKLNAFANKGSASGVGVQLLYGGKTIMPNQVTPLGKLTSSKPLSRDYKFTAQLYQLSETVTPGSVDTTATFTLDYQ